MVTFDSLPNELILQLFQYTKPQDLVRTALINPKLFNIAEPFLRRHRELHVKYAKVRLPVGLPDEEDYSIHRGRHLLRDVLRAQDIAYYINRVHIKWCILDWDDYNGHVDCERLIPPSDRELFTSALQTSAYAPTDCVDEWCEQIESGNEDLILAILLPLLPNLRSLHLSFWSEIAMSCLHEVVTNAARNFALGKAKDDAFRSLRELVVDKAPCLGYITPFMALPAIRSIQISHIWASDFDWHWGLPKSDVTDLSIVGLGPTGLALFGLLAGIKSLRRFCYDSEGVIVDFEPREIIAALLEHSKDSLESLELKIRCQVINEQYTKLQQFSRLKNLSLDYTLLDLERNKSLADVQQPSLESLILDFGFISFIDKTMMAKLDHMIRNKAKRLPLLQNLEIRYMGNVSTENLHAIEEACNSSGMSYSFVSMGDI